MLTFTVAFMVLASVLLIHFKVSTHLDFGAFYVGSKQFLREGGGTLYDLDLQRNYRIQYGADPRAHFFYPPVALLPFLPLSLMSIGAAYICWTLISVGLLILSVKWLNRLLAVLPNNSSAVSAALLFPPVLWCLMHGQTSIVALFLYTLAFRLIHSGNEMQAGLVLSLVLFKFQLVLPFALCLLLARKWRLVAGFVAGGAVVAGVSLAIVGYRGCLLYREAIARMSHANSGIFPREMASYRGLAYLISGHDPSIILIAVVSLATCVFVCRIWQRNWQIGFSAAVVASLLSGYHLNPQDLVLLIVPLFVAASLLSRNAAIFMAVCCSPLSLLLFLREVGALAAFPISALLFALYRKSISSVCLRP